MTIGSLVRGLPLPLFISCCCDGAWSSITSFADLDLDLTGPSSIASIADFADGLGLACDGLAGSDDGLAGADDGLGLFGAADGLIGAGVGCFGGFGCLIGAGLLGGFSCLGCFGGFGGFGSFGSFLFLDAYSFASLSSACLVASNSFLCASSCALSKSA